MGNKRSGQAMLIVLVNILMMYWFVAGITWQFRNPTANPMTLITRFPRVVRFERLAEYQVVETYRSIGPVGPWTVEKERNFQRSKAAE